MAVTYKPIMRRGNEMSKPSIRSINGRIIINFPIWKNKTLVIGRGHLTRKGTYKDNVISFYVVTHRLTYGEMVTKHSQDSFKGLL